MTMLFKPEGLIRSCTEDVQRGRPESGDSPHQGLNSLDPTHLCYEFLAETLHVSRRYWRGGARSGTSDLVPGNGSRIL